MRPEEETFIKTLFHSHFAQLCRYAAVYLSDRHQAEDIVQDAFHEAVNKIDEVMSHPAPEKWLKKTVKYKALNHERSQRRARAYLLPTEDADMVPAPGLIEDTVIRRDSAPSLPRIRELLGEDDFYFLTRIALDRASHAEMAEELGITVWASSKRLSRIRARLEKEFPGYRKKF